MSPVREDTEGVGEEAQVSEAEGEVARRPKTERPLVVKPKNQAPATLRLTIVVSPKTGRHAVWNYIDVVIASKIGKPC